MKQIELLDFLESLLLPSFPSTPSFPSPTLNLVVPATEIAPIWERYSFPLWSQHCDPVETTRATGWVSAEMVKEAGACGTILNHSEHRLPFSTLVKTVEICRAHRLKILVCCQSVDQGKKIAAEIKPDFLAFEPPELIASKTESVISKEKEIRELVSFLSSIPSLPSKPSLIIGAGIHTHTDIKKSKEFGAAGILIASAIMEGNKEEIKKLLVTGGVN